MTAIAMAAGPFMDGPSFSVGRGFGGGRSAIPTRRDDGSFNPDSVTNGVVPIIRHARRLNVAERRWDPAMPVYYPADPGGHRLRCSRHDRNRKRAKSLAWKGSAA